MGAVEAVLRPGDVLYIPPLWFHRVETLPPWALSVSVWSAGALEAAERAAEQIELPYGPELAASTATPDAADPRAAERSQIIRAYLVLLLAELGLAGTDAEAAAFVRERVLDARWDRPDFAGLRRGDGGGGSRPDFCLDEAALADFVSADGGFGLHLLRSTVSGVAGEFASMQDGAGPDRVEVVFVSWLERMVARAFGARRALQFLEDFARC